jgi:hypothetical protein
MTWIKTADPNDDPELADALSSTRNLYPIEYATPVFPSLNESGEIVMSHSLIPQALRHSLSTFGVLMAEDLPLSRAQHEMIATVVSSVNHCFY